MFGTANNKLNDPSLSDAVKKLVASGDIPIKLQFVVKKEETIVERKEESVIGETITKQEISLTIESKTEVEDSTNSDSKKLESGSLKRSNPECTDGCERQKQLPNPDSKRSKKKQRQEELKNNNGKPIPSTSGLCRSFSVDGTCQYGDTCKWNHNVELYLASKDPDISTDSCYLFDTYGKCPYGLTCRFASVHTTKDFKSILVPEKMEKIDFNKQVINVMEHGTYQLLRKKQLKYPRSEQVIRSWRQVKKTRKANNDIDDAFSAQQTHEATFYDTITKLKPEEIKKVDFRNKLYLAPLTTIGNLPYRRICKKMGADITCGEMALSYNLLNAHMGELALLKRHPSEDIFGVQICGSKQELIVQSAELICENYNVDFIDLNVGCPIDLITKNGGGSALLDHRRKLQDIMMGINAVSTVPVTMKLRVGKDEKDPVIHKWFPTVKSWGIKAVTIHGRSRQQRYAKNADWNYVEKCAQLTDLPVIGNGDIYSFEDYKWVKENCPNISSVMLARGAIIKPWLFTEIKEERYWDISSTERLEFIRDFCNFGLEHWGSDAKGVKTTRTFLLEWLSFLHRYVPVGLLEVIAPKLNMRPPKFIGRDDKETLLASPLVTDWIKISEMFLGPVEKDFNFTARHKANSYSDSNG